MPPKIKFFPWRVARNWIPTLVNLRLRGIDTNVLCPLCKKCPETFFHAIWECSSLKLVRLSAVWPPLLVVAGDQVLNFLILGKQVLQTEVFELLAIVLWRACFRRNKAVHSQLLLPVGEMLDWSCAFLEEFKSAMELKKSVSPSAGLHRAIISWSPHVSLLRLNVDASLNVALGVTGLGLIFRDAVGRNVVAGAVLLFGCFSPLMVEAFTVR
ncbi:hypothetical protein ACOSQ3_029771 [Xanthoceras sorbifolium]